MDDISERLPHWYGQLGAEQVGDVHKSSVGIGFVPVTAEHILTEHSD